MNFPVPLSSSQRKTYHSDRACKRLGVNQSRREDVCNRTGDASGAFCGEDEQSPLCSDVVPLAGLESSNPDPSHD